MSKTKAYNICKKLQENGFEAVYAGGVVRDMLLGVDPHDYDVATSATPDDIKKIFSSSKFVGESFGVSLVDGIEVATFRNDGSYSDNRRPDEVIFSSMEEDARRRDLTINAIFYDPIIEEYIDFIFINGMEAIDKKVIKFVGNAFDRISEDPLRILRAIRFAVKLDFSFDYYDYITIKSNFNMIKTLSSERIMEELIKGISLNDPSRYIEYLRDSNILEIVLPELYDLIDDPQDPVWHPEGSTYIHTLMVLNNIESSDWRVRFAALLHDIGKPKTRVLHEDGGISNHEHDKLGAEMAEIICNRLRVSKKDTDMIVSLIKNHMKFKSIERMKNSTLRRFISETYFSEQIDLNRADILGTERENKDLRSIDYAYEKMEKFKNEEVIPASFINGNDLLMLNVKQGPVFKIILDRMMDYQLNNVVSNREEAIEYLKKEVLKWSK